ncbi:hypothetical protein BJX70DRAFT_404737 [Aspergillus crustosus]
MAGEEVSFSYSTTHGFSIAPRSVHSIHSVRGARGGRHGNQYRNRPGHRGPVHANGNPAQNNHGGQPRGEGRRNRNRGRGRGRGGRGGAAQARAGPGPANANKNRTLRAPIPLPPNPLLSARITAPSTTTPGQILAPRGATFNQQPQVPPPAANGINNAMDQQHSGIQDVLAEVVASLNAPLALDTELQLDEAEEQDWRIVTGLGFDNMTAASTPTSDGERAGVVHMNGSDPLMPDLMEFTDHGSTSTL